MDTFYTQTICDRCGKSLKDGRTMSMFNTQCICMDCKKKERERMDYCIAQQADLAAVTSGDYNFPGIGL